MQGPADPKRAVGGKHRSASRPTGKSSTRRRVRSGDFSNVLGASKSFPVMSEPHGPFGAGALLEELNARLVSRGGRPSDPAATIRRLVPLKKQVWKELQTHARVLSGQGKHVSPGQLAAMLLEKSVASLE